MITHVPMGVLAKPPPVCSVCGDTHQMQLGDREVMCTHCPVPCAFCRAGGNGPYCTTTPCRCHCHQPGASPLTCNRHSDCDAADARAWRSGPRDYYGRPTFTRADHCHDDCCEDCFGC